MKSQIFPGLFLYWDVEICIPEVYGSDPFSLSEGCPDGFQGLHFEFLRLEKEIQIAQIQDRSPPIVWFGD